MSVSFPHYFLEATGHLVEQLKTREWIVARITSITERVVDPKVCWTIDGSEGTAQSDLVFLQDPSSNPYGLGDGVKYYMVKVGNWKQPDPTV
jgi:autophagy-related protein 11